MQIHSDREGGRLVLLVESLDLMLRNFCDDAVFLQLLHASQNELLVVMLASATGAFDRISEPLGLLMMTLRHGYLGSLATAHRAI